MWLPRAAKLEETITNCLSRKGVEVTKAQQFAKELAQYFLLIGRDKKHQILLTGYNVPDGVGDFSNLIGYYVWLKELFSGIPNVQIKVLAIVSKNKLESALKLLPDNFDKANQLHVHDVDQNIFYEHKAKNCELIILNANLGEHLSKLNIGELESLFEHNAFLQNLFNQADFLLNIATAFECTNNIFLRNINSRCWVRSVLEYGPPSSIKGFPHNSNVYVEKSMGFASNETGIKFNEAICNNQSLPPIDKRKLLSQLDNHNLRQALLSRLEANGEITLLTPESYIATTHLGVAYLQKNPSEASINYTNNFILLLAYTTAKRQIDAIININLLTLENISEQLKSQGVKQVIIHDNQGQILSEHKLNIIGHKTICLYHFSGLSNKDVAALFAVADITGGSGDNSLSDVIAARSFPFFGMLSHKISTLNNFLNLIQKLGVETNINLINYLSFMRETISQTDIVNYDAVLLCEHAKQHFNEIKQSWLNICQYIYEQRNAKQYFHEMMTLFTLMQLLGNERYHSYFNKISNLLVHYQLFTLADEHILHNAILKKRYLIAEHLLKSSVNIECRGTNYDLTCIRLAAYLKNEPLTLLFANFNADVNHYNDLIKPLLVQIVEAGFSNSTIKLIISKMNCVKFETDEEMKAILSIIANNNEYRTIFLNTGDSYNKNLLLYYAVKINDIELAHIAHAAGAENETDYSRLASWSTLIDEDDFDVTTQDTTLHMAVRNKNLDMVKLLIDRNPHFFYDQKNNDEQLVIDMTKDSFMQSLINSRNARFCFVKQFKLPSKEITNFSDKVYLEFDNYDHAWQSWLLLHQHNIICNRPHEDRPRIIVSQQEFERLIANPEFRATILPPNAVLEKILTLNLTEILKNDYSIDCKITSFGHQGLVLHIDNIENAIKLVSLLKTGCALTNFSLCKKDLTLELMPIPSEDPDIIHKFEFLLHRKNWLSKLAIRLESKFQFKSLNFDGGDITIFLHNHEDAWRLWEVLKQQRFVLSRPYEDDSEITLDLNLFHKLLRNEKIEPQIPNEIVQSILRLDVTKVIQLTLKETLKYFEPLGENRIVLYFADYECAARVNEYLEQKILMSPKLSRQDFSIEIHANGLERFKQFLESTLMSQSQLRIESSGPQQLLKPSY